MRGTRLISMLAVPLGLLCLACQSGERQQDMSDMQAREGTPRAGWRFLKTDMTPDQVFNELGPPKNMRVDLMFTVWYYSDRGDSGPHVQFDTKTMHVIRWRE